MSEPVENPERLGFDPRLDEDLAEALAVARSAAFQTSSFISLPSVTGLSIPHTSWQVMWSELSALGPRFTAIDAVLADLVPVAVPDRSFGASCAHKAAIAFWLRAVGAFQDGCKHDFDVWIQFGSKLVRDMDASALADACEREAYAAFKARRANPAATTGAAGRGATAIPAWNERPTQPALAAHVPLPVRNWLVSRFLEDPVPQPLSPDGPPLVVLRASVVTDFLSGLGVDVLATLDLCLAAGWIEDIRVDILPADGGTLPAPIAALNLPLGRNRLIGIRREVCDAPPPAPAASVVAPVEKVQTLALLSVYTNGASDDRLARADTIVASSALNASEKLTQLDATLPIPPTASANDLAQMLGVSRQAVMKTPWWKQHRKGKANAVTERRRANHEERARGMRDNDPNDE